MHGIPPLSLKLLNVIVNNEKAPTFCEDWGFDGIHSFSTTCTTFPRRIRGKCSGRSPGSSHVWFVFPSFRTVTLLHQKLSGLISSQRSGNYSCGAASDLIVNRTEFPFHLLIQEGTETSIAKNLFFRTALLYKNDC